MLRKQSELPSDSLCSIDEFLHLATAALPLHYPCVNRHIQGQLAQWNRVGHRGDQSGQTVIDSTVF
jgi:hypothetical protein